MVDLPPEFDARTLTDARTMIASLLERIGDLEDRLGGANNDEAEKSKSQIAHETEVSRRRVVAFSQDRQRRIKRGKDLIELQTYMRNGPRHPDSQTE